MRLPFLRRAERDTPLVVSMSGVRLGDSVIFAGRSASLVLPLAARTGLSGRCLVVGNNETTAALAQVATNEGLLVETSDRFPSDRSFELAVIEAVDDWAAATAGVRDAVRGGGRVLVLSGAAAVGLFSRLRSQGPVTSVDTITATLQAQRWLRVRLIGEVGGLAFVEAFA